MSPQPKFDEVVEAIEHLPLDQQADLLHLMQRRLAEKGRGRIADDVREARAEFKRGKAKRASAQEIVDEIDS